MVTEADVSSVTFPKMKMFCNQAFMMTEGNFCRKQNTFQVTKLQIFKDPISLDLTRKQPSNF